MILYEPVRAINLLQYGIQIPVRDSRAVNTFDALGKHPQLAPFLSKWHLPVITERITREDLLRVHAPSYVHRLFSQELEQELLSVFELIDAQGRYHRYDPVQARRPLTDLFADILLNAAGTVQCARSALRHGFCFYFGGGMHHGHFDHGSGFCPINDIVIAARKLQAQSAVQSVWVVDVDAHKGDGTAALTAGDATITSLSIHMASGWPLDGPPRLADGTPNPVFIPSDIDIPVESGEEKYYLERLSQGLNQLDHHGRPDLAIVVSGADPYEGDELPSTAGLRLSLDQMLARDQMVYRFLRERNIPAAYLMAGGYGDRVWEVYARFLTWALCDIYGSRKD